MNTKRPMLARVGVVVILLVAIVAVAQLKQSTTSGAGSAASSGPAAEAIGVPRMLELGSVSCIPCKMMKPVMEELEKEYGANIRIDFIDVWQDPEQGKSYGIESIPTQILYDADGKEVTRHVGFWPKDEIVAAFADNGVELKKQ